MTISSHFWRERWRRRLAVVCLYLGSCLSIALYLGTGSHSRADLSAPIVVALSAAIALFGLVGVLQSRRALLSGIPGVLDERQRGVRDQAYVHAYRLLGVLVLLIAGYQGLTREQPALWSDLSFSKVLLLVTGLAIVVFTLPSAIMAWTEPDTPEDSGAYHMINRSSTGSL